MHAASKMYKFLTKIMTPRGGTKAKIITSWVIQHILRKIIYSGEEQYSHSTNAQKPKTSSVNLKKKIS